MNKKFLQLLHISDSSFPSGAYGHSSGLEFAIEQGWVKDGKSLLAWSTNYLQFSLATLDAVAITKAYNLISLKLLENFTDGEYKNTFFNHLEELDQELASFRMGRGQREASAQTGRSFMRICCDIFSEYEVLEKLQLHIKRSLASDTSWAMLQFPIAWGIIGKLLEVELELLIQTFYLGIFRQWSHTAVRIIPIGQVEANRFVVEMMPHINEKKYIPQESETFQSCVPGIDLSCMGHYNMKARYFRS